MYLKRKRIDTRYCHRNKEQRLRLIFWLLSKRKPAENYQEIMKTFRKVFDFVEKRAFRLNERHHCFRGGTLDCQRRKMVVYRNPDWSLDLHGVYYSKYEQHCLIVSKEGALSIYKLISHEWGMISCYKDEVPIYEKKDKNGKDVFGRIN